MVSPASSPFAEVTEVYSLSSGNLRVISQVVVCPQYVMVAFLTLLLSPSAKVIISAVTGTCL